jgi:hypothetical protein
VCPHLALFDSAPSYEHLRIFDCMCYTNTTATASHKLSPRSTRCVFLGYSVDHKGYRCLDLSTNCLIVSRHVIFDEDNFPLAASPSIIDLDFLSESDPTVSTIGTHLTTAGTSTPAPHRSAPDIPPGFETPVAPLPAPTVPPGFLPRAVTTAAPRATPPAPPTTPRAAPTAPPAVTDGLPPYTWSASPVAYVRREVGVGAARTRGAPGAALRREAGAGAHATRDAHGAALSREVGAGAAERRGGPKATLSREAGTTPQPHLPRPSVGGQDVVVPVTPPDNPHQMITRGKTGFRVVLDRLVLTATTSSPTPSPIPSSARDALADPH